MTTPRASVVVAVALVLVLIGGVALSLSHGLAAMASGQREAQRADRQRAAINVQIAVGRRVASHLTAERLQAAALARALPADVDDHGVLASVVAAAAASGATLVDEERGEPAAAGAAGLLRVPVTIDVNAPAMGPLVQFASDLEHQPRLFNVSALELTTAGGDSLHVTASVYTAPLVSPPPRTLHPGPP